MGFFDVFYNEEVDMDDHLSSDESDILDAQNRDVTTIDICEGL